jgi:SAM-dependent methyltransferase
VKQERGGAFVPDDVLLPEHLARYEWAAPNVRGLRVLDVGCGYGYGSDLLLSSGARQVVAVDTDPAAIAFATRTFRRPGLNYARGKLAAVRSESMEAVVSFEVLEHVNEPDRFVHELARVLTPGGPLFLSTPNRKFMERFYVNGRSPNPFHIQEYTVPEVDAMLRRSFPEVHCYQQSSPRAYWEYSDHCAIPPRIRKLVPRSLRTAWLRFRGVGKFESAEAFHFDPVSGPAQFPPSRETQVYRCRK